MSLVHSPVNSDAFWMPFTDNRAFKARPRLLVSATGMHYRCGDGHEILDGTSGLWCVNAGHGRVPITRAIQAQAEMLDFAPTFQIGHPLAFALAGRLAALMPDGLDRIFFTNSGSEAVDTALKIALAYHRARGDGSRTRLIGRERGYHGVGFGGISVGGIGTNRRQFGPLLPGVDHLPHTWSPTAVFSRGQPSAWPEAAQALEQLVVLHGADTIAAVIVEPIAGSTGVLIPPVGYLDLLREITRRHGILLIFDEVITAFGRIGAATAAERFGVTPDLLTLAKGMTNGAVPMGAVACASEVYETVVHSAAPGIELFHGYTYSGHPLAAAAGLATLQIYVDEGLFERALALEPLWADAMHSLRDAPNVKDIRTFGLVAGVELDPRSEAPGARGRTVFHTCFDEGLLVRATGDTLALSPPLIVTQDQIGQIVDKLRDVLARTS